MKTTRLLEALELRIMQLSRDVAPLAAHRVQRPRFDKQLFYSRGTQLGQYMQEINANLLHIRHAAQAQQRERLGWLAERITAQIAALQRELATWHLRRYDVSRNSTTLNARLVKHQDYEHRLLAMQQERRQRLTQVTRLDEQQRLQRELETLDGRIARCREALTRITQVLERHAGH
ncbi:primosomal replication protein PriC [Erwinia sp. HR93]|uniref:primosomal replication protein PriC n=1 Tax=Erwinia sp. HR93 TaxID=3094840 RepID=UPI002ADEAA6D|nr:primosomal replication protein PriC [Erwinia sp. HR93]MEA1065780.1 primosomal replication protein PriC [Erwinia sp. HR93]